MKKLKNSSRPSKQEKELYVHLLMELKINVVKAKEELDMEACLLFKANLVEVVLQDLELEVLQVCVKIHLLLDSNFISEKHFLF